MLLKAAPTDAEFVLEHSLNGLCSSIKHDLRKIEMRLPLQDRLKNQTNHLGCTKWTTHGHTVPTMPPQTSMSFAFDIVCISSCCADSCQEACPWRCWKHRTQMKVFYDSLLYRTVCALQSNTASARLRCEYPYKIAWRIKAFWICCVSQSGPLMVTPFQLCLHRHHCPLPLT